VREWLTAIVFVLQGAKLGARAIGDDLRNGQVVRITSQDVRRIPQLLDQLSLKIDRELNLPERGWLAGSRRLGGCRRLRRGADGYFPESIDLRGTTSSWHA
jgi:hypothetical protein